MRERENERGSVAGGRNNDDNNAGALITRREGRARGEIRINVILSTEFNFFTRKLLSESLARDSSLLAQRRFIPRSPIFR